MKRTRLGYLLGKGKGGPPPVDCQNHKGVRASYRVACPSRGVSTIWMLCESCADEMIKHVRGAIAVPAGGKK